MHPLKTPYMNDAQFTRSFHDLHCFPATTRTTVLFVCLCFYSDYYVSTSFLPRVFGNRLSKANFMATSLGNILTIYSKHIPCSIRASNEYRATSQSVSQLFRFDPSSFRSELFEACNSKKQRHTGRKIFQFCRNIRALNP